MYLFRWRFKECIFSICEIGGNKNSRYLWQDFGKDPFLASFLPDVCGVIFVVDNQLWCGKNGRSKWTLFCPSSRACRKSTITDCLPALPVLVIANKQDLPGALTADEVFDQLSCERLPWVPEDFFCALRLVNAASPRTISVHKKKISSGTQGSERYKSFGK